jgi:hypothetical protein
MTEKAGDDLDYINRMEEKTGKCCNCGEPGHFRGTVTRRDQEEEECVEEAMVGREDMAAEEDMVVEEGGEAERGRISEAWKWMRR